MLCFSSLTVHFHGNIKHCESSDSVYIEVPRIHFSFIDSNLNIQENIYIYENLLIKVGVFPKDIITCY